MPLENLLRHSWITLILLLALPLGATAAAKPASNLATSTDSGIRLDASAAGFDSYVLPNGFKIILARYPSAPNVRIELTVKTGSLLEGYGETGMAHLLEHMLFKGAAHRSSIKSDLTKLGARWNADTTADRTSFFEIISADPTVVDEAIRIEADRFQDARFTKEDLASEMTVVRNELERNDSSPSNVLLRAVLRQSFFWHGYGRPTIGARSDIEDAPFEVLTAFHRKHYRPDNAFMIISGNFDTKRVLTLAGRLFSRSKNPNAPRIQSWTREPAQSITNRSEVYLPTGTTMTMSAWKTPGSYEEQTIALSLASAAICSDAWGSLRKEIVLNRKAANSATCFGFDKPQAGLMIATASAGKDDDVEKLSRELREYMETAAKNGITQEQLERAQQEESHAFTRISNTHDAFARMLSDAEVAGDWRLVFWEHETVKTTTLDEANSALRKWIVANNRSDVLLRHVDGLAVPELPRTSDGKAKVVGKRWPGVVTQSDPLPQNVSELAKATVTIPLGDNQGNAALIARKTQGELAWVVLGNDYGNEDSLTGKVLACQMASALYSFGGGGSNRDELDAKLEQLQATWDISMGQLTLIAPRKYVSEAFDILLAAWAKPTLPVAEFERLKSAAIASSEAALKDPAALASRQLELRFNNYPAGHPRHVLSLEQELAAIRALSFSEVRSCQTDYAGRSHIRLAVVGDFSVQDVKELWGKISAIPASKIPYKRIPEAEVPGKIDASPIVISRPNIPNANIAGMSLIAVNDDAVDFPSLRIAINILGGNTDSRIWHRLRETEGLAYGAGASLIGNAFEPRSTFSLTASAASDKAEVALTKLQEELATALKNGFSEAEVERAKKTWQQDRRKFSSEERLMAARLSQGMLTGHDFSWLAQYDQRIAGVTARSATDALRKYIAAVPIVWMIGKGSQP